MSKFSLVYVLFSVLNSVLYWTMIKSMRALKVAEDIVPVGEFKGQAARWLRHAAESGQPVVITQNGNRPVSWSHRVNTIA